MLRGQGKGRRISSDLTFFITDFLARFSESYLVPGYLVVQLDQRFQNDDRILWPTSAG